MICLKFGRVTRSLFVVIVFACMSLTILMSPAILLGQETPMGPIVVAVGPLDLRTELSEKNVKLENWPASIIPPDAVTNLKEIVDMVTVGRLAKGMPIMKNAIQHKDRLVLIHQFQ